MAIKFIEECSKTEHSRCDGLIAARQATLAFGCTQTAHLAQRGGCHLPPDSKMVQVVPSRVVRADMAAIAAVALMMLHPRTEDHNTPKWSLRVAGYVNVFARKLKRKLFM
ncbi:hypothetical protein ACLKA7_008967 [Drosophila subpalustris]